MVSYAKRVLVVEDNKADVRLLKDILERRTPAPQGLSDWQITLPLIR